VDAYAKQTLMAKIFWHITDSIYFDYGLSYQKGRKDDPLTGQIGNNEVMLLNEPGRYVYANIKYTY
jgi:hypothetical protein